LDYLVPYPNYQELLKSESNVIDHGPNYRVKPQGKHQWIKSRTKLKALNLLKNKRLASIYGHDFGSQVGTLDWIANTLRDNDDYKLQDLSLGNYEKQYNGNSENMLETKGMEEKKQAQRKNINLPIGKKGKEKKADVIDDRKQIHSKSYIKKMKKAYMSAKKKNSYYNQKYKYDKKKKNKQYGLMKMKP
jgi:hypothetical protein